MCVPDCSGGSSSVTKQRTARTRLPMLQTRRPGVAAPSPWQGRAEVSRRLRPRLWPERRLSADVKRLAGRQSNTKMGAIYPRRRWSDG